MLAKGHHFPRVTLVSILDADGGLFSGDFRASERMAQLIVQVAGRAGRAEEPGKVIIQTHLADHPLLIQLTEQGYFAFAEQALSERRSAGLPPFAHLALLRAEAHKPGQAEGFLDEACSVAEGLLGELRLTGIELLGPVPAPMERRAGRYRAQLLLQATSRAPLHRLLSSWLLALEANAQRPTSAMVVGCRPGRFVCNPRPQVPRRLASPPSPRIMPSFSTCASRAAACGRKRTP